MSRAWACFSVSLALVLALAARAQPIDDVFSKADKAKRKSSTTVEADVYRDVAKGQARTQEMVEEGDRRAEQRSVAAASAKDGRTASDTTARASGSSAGAAGSIGFICTYRCSTNAILTYAEKTRMTKEVQAADARAAVLQTADYASKTCYEQTQRVLESGSISCRKR